MAHAAGLEAHVAATHERNPFNETFHRYTQWYGLPVDSEGFLHQIEIEIARDLETHAYSFEASAYLSISVQQLYERFGARFLLLVRSPERMVNSFYRKGWYETPAVRKDPHLAPGYQANEFFHHVLARVMPSGEKFRRWNRMTRVGKLAWYWNAMNERILEQFEQIPAGHWRIEQIEQLDYERYLEVTRFLGFTVTISRETFDALRRRRPNAFSGVRTIADWTDEEKGEFEAEVAPMAERLGYEYRVDRLPLPQPDEPVQENLGLFERLRASLLNK